MIMRMILMLVAVALVATGVYEFKTFIGGKIKQSIAASWTPPVVSTIKADYQDWQPKLGAVGSVHPVNGADLSAEVSGIVEKIEFESDSDVAQGDVLVTLRAADDIARLHQLEAAAKLAEITYERDQKQLKSQAVSQATVDADIATLASAAAAVAQQQAIVDKKIIRAPFAGHAGIRQVNVGQYLNPGAPIVSLQQLDPIYIDFTLPEQALPQLQIGQKVAAKLDTDPDDTFEGQITAINSKVDEATRNIEVRATFKNPDDKLLPGMFATISIEVGPPQRYITLPQTAVTFNTYGNTVYLVQHNSAPDKPKLTVEQSVVVTGESRGDQVAVLSGVKEGDEVVTSGQVKLRNGTPVSINNDVQPANEPNPQPHEQ